MGGIFIRVLLLHSDLTFSRHLCFTMSSVRGRFGWCLWIRFDFFFLDILCELFLFADRFCCLDGFE